MALTQEERAIANELKSKGYSPLQVSEFIATSRSGNASESMIGGRIKQDLPQDFSKDPLDKFDNTIIGTIKDIPSDLKETYGSAVDSVVRGIEKSRAIRQEVYEGKTSPLKGTFRTIGAGFGAGAEVLGQGLMGAAKTLASPRGEEKFKQDLGANIKKVVDSKAGQYTAEQWGKLNEDQKQDLIATGQIVEGVTTMFGFGFITNRLKSAFGRSTAKFFRQSDEILEASKAKNGFKPSKVVTAVDNSVDDLLLKLDETIDDARVSISDIDPQVESALRVSSFDDVNKYFQQARNAVKDPSKATPFEIVGSKAEEAYTTIKNATTKAVDGKKNMIVDKGNINITAGTLDDVFEQSRRSISERFGIDIDSTGKISTRPDRFSQLDGTDAKLLSDYLVRFNELGSTPTLRQVDDFVDWSQSQLYKQSQSLSKLETASDPVISELKQFTGRLNSQLKGEIPGYAEVNARISKLLTLQEEISRALGADTRKGAGFVKRLFSPAGGNTRRIFQQIEAETGIDLFKEATLAKFAMESAGDVRQRSLLKDVIGELEGTAELDLTKPMSIVRWLRERADLDGQELANKMIRKFKTEELNKLDVPEESLLNTTDDVLKKAGEADQISATAVLEETPDVKPSLFQRIKDKVTGKDIPNKKGGFIKLPESKKVIKEIDELTKDELWEAKKLLNGEASKITENQLDSLLEKFEISPDWSISKIQKRIDKILDKTKTKPVIND